MNFFDMIQKLDEGTHEYDNIKGFRSSKGVSQEEINVAKYIAAHFKKNGGSDISTNDVKENGLVITITSIVDNIARARVISDSKSENISMDVESKKINFSKPALKSVLHTKDEKESDYKRAMRIEAQKKIAQKYREAQTPQEQLKKAIESIGKKK